MTQVMMQREKGLKKYCRYKSCFMLYIYSLFIKNLYL